MRSYKYRLHKSDAEVKPCPTSFVTGTGFERQLFVMVIMVVEVCKETIRFNNCLGIPNGSHLIQSLVHETLLKAVLRSIKAVNKFPVGYDVYLLARKESTYA